MVLRQKAIYFLKTRDFCKVYSFLEKNNNLKSQQFCDICNYMMKKSKMLKKKV